MESVYICTHLLIVDIIWLHTKGMLPIASMGQAYSFSTIIQLNTKLVAIGKGFWNISFYQDLSSLASGVARGPGCMLGSFVPNPCTHPVFSCSSIHSSGETFSQFAVAAEARIMPSLVGKNVFLVYGRTT